MGQYCNTANIPIAPSQKGDHKAIDRHPNGSGLLVQSPINLLNYISSDRTETLPIVLFLGLNVSLDVDHALCRNIFL
jgi:hypothetical protein